jgi:hypothetical protein
MERENGKSLEILELRSAWTPFSDMIASSAERRDAFTIGR